MRILTRWAGKSGRWKRGPNEMPGRSVSGRNANICNCIYGHQRARANNQPQNPARPLAKWRVPWRIRLHQEARRGDGAMRLTPWRTYKMRKYIWGHAQIRCEKNITH